jgi:hypothetical protein
MRHYIGMCLKSLRKNIKICNDKWSLGQHFNASHPEYKTGVIPIQYQMVQKDKFLLLP